MLDTFNTWKNFDGNVVIPSYANSIRKHDGRPVVSYLLSRHAHYIFLQLE